MKKITLLLTVLLAAAPAAMAQNNPYGIDDECYGYFVTTEKYVGDFESPEFDEAMTGLLQTALRKKDTKAQAIYYVTKLRRTTNIGRAAPNNEREKWNAAVEEAREAAQSIARSTGYMQYYYYANELTQTYYYNTQQSLAAMEMLSSIMSEARESGDEYGLWTSEQYIAKLYTRQSDDYNARPHLRAAIERWENTTDETVRRQSIARLYQDLADTYEPGSDSCRLAIQGAITHAITTIDSIRVLSYRAQLAAWDNDQKELRAIQAEAQASLGVFERQIRGGSAFLACMEGILAGRKTDELVPLVKELVGHRQKYVIFRLAVEHRMWELSSYAAQRFMDQIRLDLAGIGEQRIGELSARFENNRLTADLAATSRKMARTTLLVAILIIALLLSALFYTWHHLRTLKKAQANKPK